MNDETIKYAIGEALMWRGAERIIIVLIAMLTIYLGYRLFRSGITEGFGKIETDSQLFKIIFSGSGPGLFFMAFGCLLCLYSVNTPMVQLSNAGPKKASNGAQQSEDGTGTGTDLIVVGIPSSPGLIASERDIEDELEQIDLLKEKVAQMELLMQTRAQPTVGDASPNLLNDGDVEIRVPLEPDEAESQPGTD